MEYKLLVLKICTEVMKGSEQQEDVNIVQTQSESDGQRKRLRTMEFFSPDGQQLDDRIYNPDGNYSSKGEVCGI